jgi:NAD(P)-dependent dehydrogenase (short-subunit alcohol dehydrogenase family)
MSQQLAGKAGVIVGATSGLGLATLRAMTRAGASIVAVGRDVGRGEAVVAEVVAAGARACFLAADVTDEEAIRGAIALCEQEYGRLEIMHNNAGVLLMGALHETSNADWQRTLAINLTGVFWGCKHAVLAMRGRGGGSIINTASVAAFTATGETLAYATSKAAVIGLTRETALAYAADGIRCNAVCPGDFESPMLDDYFAAEPDPSEARSQMEAIYPTGTIPTAAQVADAVVYLASDAAAAVNGTSLVVDHGLIAKTY